ncbi:MAG: hypothetical protein WBC92_13535, partial [Terracidiphilus sp.]
HMYMACRHIKPNGIRCKSPALKGNSFCYYHARLHTLGKEPYGKFGPMRLPVPEDSASIQLSIAKISDALINDQIDSKRAGRLLYAMQIATQNIDRKKEFADGDTVPSATETSEGDDLAPELRVCGATDKCESCQYAKDCPNYHEEEVDTDKALLKALLDIGKNFDVPLRDPDGDSEQIEDDPVQTALNE